MYFLGIDPGVSGAFAILHETEVFLISKFNKQAFLSSIDYLAREHEATRCCIEKVHAMPKQGVTSMFTFGENYGWLKGVLDAREISYQEIPPQTWKKEFNLNSDKNNSIDTARQLFPKAVLTPDRARKPDNNIAEAMLMAEYARRML